MQTFTKDRVIILPHAETYRDLYNVSFDEIFQTLNEPQLRLGLPDDRFTNEKTIRKKRIYIYYYQTYPMQAKKDELLAIVDFVGISEEGNGKNK